MEKVWGFLHDGAPFSFINVAMLAFVSRSSRTASPSSSTRSSERRRVHGSDPQARSGRERRPRDEALRGRAAAAAPGRSLRPHPDESRRRSDHRVDGRAAWPRSFPHLEKRIPGCGRSRTSRPSSAFSGPSAVSSAPSRRSPVRVRRLRPQEVGALVGGISEAMYNTFARPPHRRDSACASTSCSARWRSAQAGSRAHGDAAREPADAAPHRRLRARRWPSSPRAQRAYIKK